MVINYFIHDICFCLFLHNFKVLNWCSDPRWQNKDGTFCSFSRAWEARMWRVPVSMVLETLEF